MPTFICQLNWTDEGVKKPSRIPFRRGMTRSHIAEVFGLKISQILYTSGDTDILMILDAPNDQAVAKWALAIGTNGNVRTRTARAFTEDEFDGILGDLQSRSEEIRRLRAEELRRRRQAEAETR